MPIRLSGLNSGLDTESIIQALVSSYSVKKDNYVKAQTKLSWTQDAWKSLNTKIYSLYDKIGKLKYSDAWNMKTTTVSDSTKAKVTAGGKAVNGSYSLRVEQLAKTGYLTGGELKEGTTEASTLGELGYTGDGEIEVSVGNGETKRISVSADTTVGDFVSQLNEAGVKASFDSKNLRIHVAASDTGAKNDFKLSGDKIALGMLGLDEEAGTLGADATEKSTLADLGYDGFGYIQVTASDGQKKDIFVDQYTTVEQFVEDLNNAGVNAEYDAADKKIDVSGNAGEFQLSGDANALHAFGLNGDAANRIHGQDSVIWFNGAKYTSSSNSYEINGLTIEALAETGDQEVGIATRVDTEGIYNKIKDFLKDYNELINEMTKLYGADSSKGYEPLTSDEKDAMTDTQVEEWEKKIKDSLLRRDSTLSGIMTTMRTSMSKSYTIDGKNYSLSSFGIATLGILNAPKNEESAYHIDGNKDDSSTSNKEDKLMSMLTTDPDTVVDFMKQLATGLYDGLHKKMGSTTLSSAYVVYNDKQMAREYSDYTTTIKKWEQKVADMEDSYYKKFAAMESALAKLQSSSSSLGTLLGG